MQEHKKQHPDIWSDLEAKEKEIGEKEVAIAELRKAALVDIQSEEYNQLRDFREKAQPVLDEIKSELTKIRHAKDREQRHPRCQLAWQTLFTLIAFIGLGGGFIWLGQTRLAEKPQTQITFDAGSVLVGLAASAAAFFYGLRRREQ